MPIRFTCPSCHRAINAPDAAAGKSASCPGCKQAIQVPTPATVPPVVAPPVAIVAPAAAAAASIPLRPHRGVLVLLLGIFSLVTVLFSLLLLLAGGRGCACMLFFVALTVVLGQISWQLGRSDLAAMDGGKMDESGRDLTDWGRVLGKTSVSIVGVMAVIALVLLVVLLIYLATQAGNRSGTLPDMFPSR